MSLQSSTLTRARRRRGDQGRRHAAAHGPEPAGCELQRPRARKRPQVRRSGTRLALSAASGDAALRQPQRSRRSSTSDTMNPDPGHHPSGPIARTTCGPARWRTATGSFDFVRCVGGGHATTAPANGSTARKTACPGHGHSAGEVRDLAWTRPCRRGFPSGARVAPLTRSRPQ
jgi:hypothetical protein